MQYFLQGFLICAGLITTIGAQNAFLIKQGLLKQHILSLILLFFICDVVLFYVTIFGLGTFINQDSIASVALAFIGSLFLLVYGTKSLISAYQGSTALLVKKTEQSQSFKKIILIGLAVTLLNPHVYLDVVVIIGGIAGTLPKEGKLLFLIGNSTASALWFFGVGYGSRLLAPLFKRPITWQILDTLTAIIMWIIAFSLAKYAVNLL
ncbi:LysE/ArgO family amino acid transporter [Seminibacterium arietis]|uniref:LysE/ArgO family amino acid transporter n=1 Tax=Seminibacterium arietis TaxID=1173502 RepID=A0ABW3IAQ8_9PAST